MLICDKINEKEEIPQEKSDKSFAFLSEKWFVIKIDSRN